MTKKTKSDKIIKMSEDQTCQYCGKFGLTDFMYLYGQNCKWYHANCIKKDTIETKKILFGDE